MRPKNVPSASSVALSPLEAGLYQKTLSCVHCGLCLPACPAYQELGRESVAPRGQVYNVRAMLEGRLPLSATLSEDIYDCLACRGCESVCPAGVPVGAIMEEVRGLITERATEGLFARAAKRFWLDAVLAHPNRLSWAIKMLRLYQVSGARALLRRAGVLRLLPGRLAEREALVPHVPPRGQRQMPPESVPASGKARGRVALFAGCIAPHLFAHVHRATARVLQRNGFEVVIPRQQGCCGALHLHNGLPDVARRLALQNVEAFLDTGADAIVVNAAGCGAALAEYAELLPESQAARTFAERVVDVSAFLVREGFESPGGRLNARVAYDPPCHLFHAQRIRDEPRRLLRAIPGVQIIDVADAERCCGSAGIYNVTHFDLSMRVLDEKMKRLAIGRPQIITSGNPGCLLQIDYGVRRAGLAVEVTHPIVLLDRSYGEGTRPEPD